jgi:hypothetical protein
VACADYVLSKTHGNTVSNMSSRVLCVWQTYKLLKQALWVRGECSWLDEKQCHYRRRREWRNHLPSRIMVVIV